MKKEKDFKKWLSLLVVITLSILLADMGASMKLIDTLVSSLNPIFVGVIIAYVLYLPAKRIETRLGKKDKGSFAYKNKRTISIVITYFVMFLVIVAMFSVISPIISSSINDLLKNLPKSFAEIEKSKALNNEFGKYLVKQLEKIDFSKLLSFEKVIEYLKNTISFAKGFFTLFVSVVASVYLLAERKQILAFWDRQIEARLSKEKYTEVCYYMKKTNSIFANYLSGQILDAVVVGVIMTIILIALNIKYSVLLGVIIGISNLIPFFGAIFGIGFSIIIIALTTGIKEALIAGAITLIMQQVDANIINPKITSTKVDISPILTIISITVLGSLFGVLGMFLAVPVIAIVKTIMIDSADKRIEQMKLE